MTISRSFFLIKKKKNSRKKKFQRKEKNKKYKGISPFYGTFSHLKFFLQSRRVISLNPLFPHPANKYTLYDFMVNDAHSLPSGRQVLGSTGYQ